MHRCILRMKLMQMIRMIRTMVSLQSLRKRKPRPRKKLRLNPFKRKLLHNRQRHTIEIEAQATREKESSLGLEWSTAKVLTILLYNIQRSTVYTQGYIQACETHALFHTSSMTAKFTLINLCSNLISNLYTKFLSNAVAADCCICNSPPPTRTHTNF